ALLQMEVSGPQQEAVALKMETHRPLGALIDLLDLHPLPTHIGNHSNKRLPCPNQGGLTPVALGQLRTVTPLREETEVLSMNGSPNAVSEVPIVLVKIAVDFRRQLEVVADEGLCLRKWQQSLGHVRSTLKEALPQAAQQ